MKIRSVKLDDMCYGADLSGVTGNFELLCIVDRLLTISRICSGSLSKLNLLFSDPQSTYSTNFMKILFTTSSVILLTNR